MIRGTLYIIQTDSAQSSGSTVIAQASRRNGDRLLRNIFPREANMTVHFEITATATN
jgi:hypothetical protein